MKPLRPGSQLCFILCLLVNCIERNESAALEQHYSEVVTQEYCTAIEPFEASCLKNEVIVMTSAIYGRMKLGRCLESEERQLFVTLEKDPKFIGCSDDVIHLMNRKCSGTNRCEVRLKDFETFKPCYAALQLYLEAGYKCLTVTESDRSCVVPVSSNPLHIVLSSASKLGCGTKSQPWIIEAPSGQQINVSLLDFGSKVNEPTSDQWKNCQQYGYIIDKSAKKNVSICRVDQEGQSVVYKSHSNSVEIVTSVGSTGRDDIVEKKSRVLVGFYAIGCSNLVPPEDTWLRRNGNEATLGCYTSQQTWHLCCTENHWIGVIGNCSREQADLKTKIPRPDSSSTNLNQVSVMVTIIVVCFIICVTIICCGAVCLKRHYVLSARKHFHLIEENYKKFNGTIPDYRKNPILEPDQQI